MKIYLTRNIMLTLGHTGKSNFNNCLNFFSEHFSPRIEYRKSVLNWNFSWVKERQKKYSGWVNW